MTIEQTIDIPADHRLILDIPKEVPADRAQVIIRFPVTENAQTGEAIPSDAKGQTGNEAFRRAISRAYGAWKDNPWTNHIDDVNAMRDEWDHRDPWNPDAAKRHND